MTDAPAGEVAVDSACELSPGSVPLVCRLEGDMGCSVVDDRVGAHPEVVAKPGHEPVLDKAKPASVIYKGRKHGGHEEGASRNADLHLQHACINILRRTAEEAWQEAWHKVLKAIHCAPMCICCKDWNCWHMKF